MQAESGDDAVFMAGGIDLINRMKFGEPVAEVTSGVAPVRAINQSHSSSIPAPPCATARSPKHSPWASIRQT